VRPQVRAAPGQSQAGKRPKKRGQPETAGRPETAAPTPLAGRWLRRNGRLDPQRPDRSQREIGDSGGVKREIAPLYVDMRTSAL
jgi:hypothetical protein